MALPSSDHGWADSKLPMWQEMPSGFSGQAPTSRSLGCLGDAGKCPPAQNMRVTTCNIGMATLSFCQTIAVLQKFDQLKMRLWARACCRHGRAAQSITQHWHSFQVRLELSKGKLPKEQFRTTLQNTAQLYIAKMQQDANCEHPHARSVGPWPWHTLKLVVKANESSSGSRSPQAFWNMESCQQDCYNGRMMR